MAGQLHLTVEGTTATLTLDNPGRRNAVSGPLFEQLGAAVDEIARSSEIRAVVLTGKGEHFSVGADLAAPPESRTLRRDSVADDIDRLRQVSATLVAFHQLPQVTVAAIDGACAGAGLSLAAAADFRVASDRAVFSTAFVNAGLSGDLGGVWLITHMLGAARARELFLTPEKLTAQRALEIGLVGSVVPTSSLPDSARDLAHRIGSSAPLALRAAKQNLLAAAVTPLADYLVDEVDRMVRCAHSDDAREAATAFLEKRRPAFAGA